MTVMQTTQNQYTKYTSYHFFRILKCLFKIVVVVYHMRIMKEVAFECAILCWIELDYINIQ